MNERRAVSVARSALEAVLDESKSPMLREALETWATPPPIGRFILGTGSVYGDDAVFIVWDSNDRPSARLPYLARMKFSRGQWLTVSLLSQCTACFGNGLLAPDDSPCGSCMARGWGLLDSRDFAIVVELPEPALAQASVGGAA